MVQKHRFVNLALIHCEEEMKKDCEPLDRIINAILSSKIKGIIKPDLSKFMYLYVPYGFSQQTDF